MPTGNAVAAGGFPAVPLYDAFEAVARNAGTDWATFTNVVNATGDFLVYRDPNNQANSEKFVVEADGTLQKFKVNVVTKTAAYTVTSADSGTFFTTFGATNGVVFTLPAVEDGLFYRFMAATINAGASMAITAPANGTLVAFNTINATTLTVANGGRICGMAVDVWSNGTKWFANTIMAFDGGVTNGGLTALS